MNTGTYTEKELIDTLRKGGQDRDRVLQYLLKSGYRSVVDKAVTEGGGTEAEASAVFEDTLIRFDRVVRRMETFTQNSLDQFFEEESKLIWCDKLRVDETLRGAVLDNIGGDKKLRKMILSNIVKHGAEIEDAQDCYQNGVMLLAAQLKEGKYQGGAIKGFFYQICFNLWRNELKRKKPVSIEPDELNLVSSSDGPQHRLEAQERAALLDKIFSMMGESCQKILNLKFCMIDQFSMEDIAQQMGLKSAQNASNALSKCRKRLWELLNEQAFDHTYIWKKNI